MTADRTNVARILVVDDDPRIAASVRRALVYEGYRVEVAIDGPAALAACRDETPDLVVLDRMLPGLDGVEVARRLRAADAGLPILISQYPEDDRERRPGTSDEDRAHHHREPGPGGVG